MPFVRHSNLIVSLAVAFLVALGLVMLASTSVWIEGEGQHYHHVTRQAIWVAVGLFVALLAAATDYRNLRQVWPWLLGGACVLLALCYVPGIAIERYGEARWIRVPLIGQFQPSEAAKPVLVIALAAWFAHYQAETRSFWKGFVVPGVLLGLPVALIFFEKDMGTAVSVGIAGFAVLFLAGVRFPYLLVSSVTAGALFWHVVRSNENRWNRIMAFLDLEAHKLDFGLQQWRALLAFGSGGTSGLGLGNGMEKHGYLPFAHTDFIFPMVGEELGLWFTLGIVLCYVLISVFGLLIAVHASDPFGRLLAAGLTAMLVVPAILNIAVTTACVPNTGLPLPFVSYGGSNLVFALASVGLLASIHRRTAVVEHGALPFEKKQRRYAVRL
jgi:cell division protein FtsW